MYYYGSQYGKRANPNNLWRTYFTSSKKVKKLIEEYGIESFEYEIRKTFNDPVKCLLWEILVIHRLNLVKRKDFLNQKNVIGGNILLKYNVENCFKGKTDRWSDEYKKLFSVKTKNFNKKTGKISQRMKDNNPGKFTRHITNGITNKRVKCDELQLWLDSGFKIGRTDDRIYINNGDIEKKIKVFELQKWEALGFIKGSLNKLRDENTGRFMKKEVDNEDTN